VRSLTPLGHESASLTPASRATFWRTLQTFNLTRVAIGLVLLAYLGINSRKGFWSPDGFIYLETCVVYLALAVVFTIVAARWRHHFLSQMTLQLVVDVIIITLLYTEAGGSKSGLAILYLFPLAGSAILAPMLLALFFVSLVTLVLLLESAWRLLESTSESTISVSGLYGAAFFAAVYMINRLAGRLIRQEQLTASHGQDLRIQQSINRLVIAAMGDGVLVVGNDGTILTANPAAERLLGMGMLAPADETLRLRLTDVALLNPIGEAFFGWWTRRGDAPVFVVIKPGDDAGSVGASAGSAANAPVAPAQRPPRTDPASQAAIRQRGQRRDRRLAHRHLPAGRGRNRKPGAAAQAGLDGPAHRQHRPRSAQPAVGDILCRRPPGRGAARSGRDKAGGDRP
jgi:two-component system sensor histidine kinase PilS (NtrC family)